MFLGSDQIYHEKKYFLYEIITIFFLVYTLINKEGLTKSKKHDIKNIKLCGHLKLI